MMLLFLIGCAGPVTQRQAQYNTDSLLTDLANRVEYENDPEMKQSYQDYLYLLSRQKNELKVSRRPENVDVNSAREIMSEHLESGGDIGAIQAVMVSGKPAIPTTARPADTAAASQTIREKSGNELVDFELASQVNCQGVFLMELLLP